jgi:hypothetical protein
MTKLLAFILLGCGIGLALVAGSRLTTDTAAVIIGVTVGIGASVPVSLLLVALLSRRTASYARPVPAPTLPARSAPAPVAPLRAGPPPVAADKARAQLGPDLRGVPLVLDFGGTDAAANLLVVGAPDAFFTVLAAAEQAGWQVEPVAPPADLAHWARLCRDSQLRWPQPVVLVIEDLADLFTGSARENHEVDRRLHYLTTHGPSAGLHVLAGARRPDALGELGLTPWPVRIAGPGKVADLAAALDLTAEVAAELTDSGAHWLSARGNLFGFYPAVV